MTKFMHNVRELRAIDEVDTAGMWKVYFASQFDVTWALSQNVDGVGKQRRFAQIMGDENNRAALLKPDIA